MTHSKSLIEFLAQLVFALCVSILFATPDQCATVCYIKQGKVFTVPAGQHGTLGPSHCLYDLNKSNLVLDNCVLLGRNKQTGLVLFTYDDDANEEVWSVSKRCLTRVLTNADDPVISPDGTEIAFCRGPNVDIYNYQTKLTRTIARNGQQPSWGSGCSLIAFVETPSSDESTYRLEVVDSSTGTLVFKRTVNDATLPHLSPSSNYLAYVGELAMAVQGDRIVRVRGSAGPTTMTGDYAPACFLPGESVEDWSQDENWILWDWETRDPNSIGYGEDDYVGLTSLDGRMRRNLGPGEGATFCPGDTTVYFLRMQGKVTLSQGATRRI
jgi:hypothetical protein